MKLNLKFFNVLIAVCLFFTNFCWAQIGIGTNTPDSSAQLDIFSINKGFLPPRLALTATNLAAPVINPAVGLLVYNYATAGTIPTNVVPGYYYWNGAFWYQVINKGNAPGDMQYWNGEKWVIIPIGTNGSVLKICNGIPTWGNCSPLTLQPASNQNEGHVDSYNQTGGPGDIVLEIGAWTINGTPTSWRSFIKFDQTQLPANATIVNATLYLYATPTPAVGTSAQLGTANAFYVERITGAWNPASFTWNTQPVTTSTNRVAVAQSVAGNENAVIDVTGILQDMQASGNYGFALRLQNETYYNMRQYASSFSNNPALHPKLVITFQ